MSTDFKVRFDHKNKIGLEKFNRKFNNFYTTFLYILYTVLRYIH